MRGLELGQVPALTLRASARATSTATSIRAGMQELTSITSTVAEMGHVVARVHAVNDPAVAWDDELQDEQLFILLDQLHYDQENRPFMHTRSYFIEGRFNFTVVRHSPNR